MYTKFIFASIAITSFIGCNSKSKPTPFPTGEVIAVQVATAGSTTQTDSIEVTGVLATEQEARYSFKIGGVVDRVFVTEGQSFRKGQLLATLLLTEISKQQEQANLGLEKAKRDYDRARNLYADSVATLEQVQNAETGVNIARKSADIVAFNQQYARIYAPVDGFVTRRLASEGEIVGPGTPVLLANETGSNAPWVLRVGVTDQVWAQTTTGQIARVKLDAFRDAILTGTVGRKSLTADPYSGSFQLEIKIPTPKLPLALGMFGRAWLVNPAQTSNRLEIPYSALVEANGNEAFVFVVQDSNRVRKAPIQLASIHSNRVQIASGISPTDRIVISNTAFLNEQSTISIIR